MLTKKFTLNEKELTEMFLPHSALLLRALQLQKMKSNWSLCNTQCQQSSGNPLLLWWGLCILNIEGVFKASQRHGKRLPVKDLGKGCMHIYKAAIVAQQTMHLQFIFTPINKYDQEKINVKNPESTKTLCMMKTKAYTCPYISLECTCQLVPFHIQFI